MPTLFPTGINLTALEEAILKNDLLDIEAWVRGALAGKINNCRKRMEAGEIARLQADPTVTSIPKNRDVLLEQAIASPSYKDRAARDEDEKKRLAARRGIVA